MSSKWITATVLQALADHGLGKTNASFYGTELLEWLGEQLTTEQRWDATSRLCRLEFIQHVPVVEPGRGRVDKYLITAAGAAAIREAAAGKVRKSGPKGSRTPHAPSKDALVCRLWALLRMRRVVETDTAAETLCDAGDDNRKVQDNIRRYLKRWEKVGAVKGSKGRVRAEGPSQGVRRYYIQEAFLNQTVPPRWVHLGKTAQEPR